MLFLPCSSCRSDSFEGQSQWEWDRPSDKRWLPSTSVGFPCLRYLIMLQSYARALRVVNYFAEQRGDVPSCERERKWETWEQKFGVGEDKTNQKKSRKGRKDRKWNGAERRGKIVRRCRKNERWKGRAGVLPPIISPPTACRAGDRPALMNKVTNLSLTKQSKASENVICEETEKDNC